MSEKMIGIYKITNKINGKFYIGQSINIMYRWSQHLYASGKSPNQIDYDIKEYGIENFQFEILEGCAQESLLEREKYWIEKTNAYELGYNQKAGQYDKSGCNNPKAVFTKQEVIDIRSRLRDGISKEVIWLDYKDKVSRSAFNRVCNYTTYKEIN